MLAVTRHASRKRASSLDAARFIGACTLTAVPQVGVAVGVTLGPVYGSGAITYGYQWMLDGSSIGGATATTYTPISGDATHLLRCDVTPNGSGGTVGATQTNAVAVAAGGGTGVADVAWEAPLFDGDGAALSDLANFRVYWGATYPVTATNAAGNSGLLNSSTLTYHATGLVSGLTYFTVVAVDSGGNESNFGVEASKTIL